MRHRKKNNHLSRTADHRAAMLSNMASSLMKHKRIKTTLAKAKALRKYVEPLITRSKDDTMHSRRMVFSYLQDKEAVTELFRNISPKVAERPGGYTRILKTGFRPGDAAEMCFIELVDFNQAMLDAKGEKKAKETTSKRRRRGSGASAKTEPKAVAAETKIEEPTAIKEEAAIVEETIAEAPVVEETAAEEAIAETTTAKEEKPQAEVENSEPEKDEATEEKEEDKKPE